MKLKFIGTIKDGRIKLKHADAFNRVVAGYKSGTEIDLVIDRHREARSDNQNRYYWGVLVKILADHLGYFPKDMHRALGHEFLFVDAKPIPFVRSTADMTTKEFEDYMEKVRTWAQVKYDVKIPLPNEVDFE